MLSVENSKMKDRKLILMARFSIDYTQDKLIPEIETNCVEYRVDPQLAANFQRNKFAANSLYFHHAHAYADIPSCDVRQLYSLSFRLTKRSPFLTRVMDIMKTA